METKKLFVAVSFIIAASFLGLSCQKDEPDQEQASAKHLVEEESAQGKPLQAQQAPARPLQYEDKEEDEGLADEDEEDNEDDEDEEDGGNRFAYLESELEEIVEANPGSELATRMQEVMANVFMANLKLKVSQKGSALSELQAAMRGVESAITDGLIDSVEGQELIDDLTDEIQEISSTP
jgi:hypothetical protein